MQNTTFKYASMNDIQNLIIREKLEDSITLKEFKTNNGYSTVKYSLYHNGLLVSSFTDEVDDSGAIREEKEKLWLIKLDKEERCICGERIDISNNLDDYYKTLEFYRERNKELGYGDDEKNWELKMYENQRRNLKKVKRIELVNKRKKMIKPKTG